MHRLSLIFSIAAFAVAAPLGAQQLGPSRVPDGHKPPPGMCRIWIDGVPPGQQSAPTDCATAVRNRPSNGRVVWGDDDRKRDADRPVRTNGNGDRPRETEERPRREPREAESPKPRETRETPKREAEEQRPRTTPSRKPKADDSKTRPPSRRDRDIS